MLVACSIAGPIPDVFQKFLCNTVPTKNTVRIEVVKSSLFQWPAIHVAIRPITTEIAADTTPFVCDDHVLWITSDVIAGMIAPRTALNRNKLSLRLPKSMSFIVSYPPPPYQVIQPIEREYLDMVRCPLSLR